MNNLSVQWFVQIKCARNSMDKKQVKPVTHHCVLRGPNTATSSSASRVQEFAFPRFSINEVDEGDFTSSIT